MDILPILILWPLLIAGVVSVIRSDRVRGILVYVGAGGVMATAALVLGLWLANGAQIMTFYRFTELVDHLMTAGELFLMVLIVCLSIKHRKYPVALLSVGQTAVLLWSEFTTRIDSADHMQVDSMTMLMCIIVAFVGGLICIYSVGYMREYHRHHKEFKDRSGFFFSMLFLFLAAMFGLVLSENLVWMYFFWEITSVISFLLIGYTRTEEAVHNSFRALWMNLLGGLGFAIAIAVAAATEGTVQLGEVVAAGAVIPVALLSLAGLTKSAQLPFSSWLLGAMVAPTPSSALLHSATTVSYTHLVRRTTVPGLASVTWPICAAPSPPGRACSALRMACA